MANQGVVEAHNSIKYGLFLALANTTQIEAKAEINIVTSRLVGTRRNGRLGKAVVQIDVPWHFGAGGNSVARRSFGHPKPLDQPFWRGMF